MSTNEKIAKFMGWKFKPAFPFDLRWQAPKGDCCDAPPRYDSDDSPRSLMAGVESELIRLGLWDSYTGYFDSMLGDLQEFGSFRAWTDEQWMRTAPAAARAAAAACAIDSQPTQPEGFHAAE